MFLFLIQFEMYPNLNIPLWIFFFKDRVHVTEPGFELELELLISHL